MKETLTSKVSATLQHRILDLVRTNSVKWTSLAHSKRLKNVFILTQKKKSLKSFYIFQHEIEISKKFSQKQKFQHTLWKHLKNFLYSLKNKNSRKLYNKIKKKSYILSKIESLVKKPGNFLYPLKNRDSSRLHKEI